MRIGKLFSPLTLLRRRDKIREKIRDKKAEGFLVLHQPNIFYLTGFTGEGFFLLLREKSFLFTDYRYLPSSPPAADDWEFVPVKKDYYRSLREKIQEEKAKKIAVEAIHVSVARWKELNKCKNVKWLLLPGCVEEARTIKDKEEIEFIKEALNISKKVLKEVPGILRAGMQERELAVEIEYRLRKYGSEPLPFVPIVASGKNASLPHATPGTNKIEPGEPLIVDLGARVNGYCADLTGTFFPGREESKWKERKILVEEAIRISLASIKPGVKCKDIFLKVRDFFKRHQVEKNFLHALGHGVGIEVHELPTLSFRGKEEIKENMVFTLEPGLYFPGEGGVRKEIMVLVQGGDYGRSYGQCKHS